MVKQTVGALEQVTALKRSTMNREAIKIDEDLYPRYAFDRTLVSTYVEAMRTGTEFPPLKVDQNGRLIDGLHRLKAYEALDITQIPIEREKVKDDVDFFERALTANAHHGRRYTHIDYANMVLKAKELGIDNDRIAKLVYVTPGFLEEVTRDWFALNGNSERVALKRTIRHMKGRKLNKGQLEANKKLSGMQPAFYANQIVLLCDNDLIDTENTKTIEALQRCQESLANFFLGLAKRGKGKLNGAKN